MYLNVIGVYIQVSNCVLHPHSDKRHLVLSSSIAVSC